MLPARFRVYPQDTYCESFLVLLTEHNPAVYRGYCRFYETSIAVFSIHPRFYQRHFETPLLRRKWQVLAVLTALVSEYPSAFLTMMLRFLENRPAPRSILSFHLP